jgi:hypothetical protein
LLMSAIIPVVVFAFLMAGHNELRHGSWTDFGSAERLSPTLAAPLNWLGLLAAPGKGLLLYSPLVLLGILGLRDVWRRDRVLAFAILGPVLALSAVIAVSSHWSDETWGPRYIVPVASLLLIPVVWWTVTNRRKQVRNAVAAAAVAVALLGVLVPYSGMYNAAPALTGVPLFQNRTSSAGGTDISDSDPDVPYGRDGIRWIPQLSPLLFHAQLMESTAIEAFSGEGLTITYAPFEGRRVSLSLTDFDERFDVRLPDLFWLRGHGTDLVLALASALLLVLSGAVLRRTLAQLKATTPVTHPIRRAASVAPDTTAPPPS